MLGERTAVYAQRELLHGSLQLTASRRAAAGDYVFFTQPRDDYIMSRDDYKNTGHPRPRAAASAHSWPALSDTWRYPNEGKGLVGLAFGFRLFSQLLTFASTSGHV